MPELDRAARSFGPSRCLRGWLLPTARGATERHMKGNNSQPNTVVLRRWLTAKGLKKAPGRVWPRRGWPVGVWTAARRLTGMDIRPQRDMTMGKGEPGGAESTGNKIKRLHWVFVACPLCFDRSTPKVAHVVCMGCFCLVVATEQPSSAEGGRSSRRQSRRSCTALIWGARRSMDVIRRRRQNKWKHRACVD